LNIGSIIGEVVARPMAGPEAAPDADRMLEAGAAPAGQTRGTGQDEIGAIDPPRG
jgi:hypothetical protein